MKLLALVACALLGAGSSSPPADLHVTVECVDKLPGDKNVSPQFNLYVGADPDLTVAFKITRADGDHPGYPVGSTIYLSVSRYFFEAELGLQHPAVQLAVGSSYDLHLEKSSDGSHWNYKIKAR
jgi:hypothetical protein